METMAIYKATLKLIKEGKISFLTMAEIGYHARVSASTVETLFQDREQLVSFVGNHTFGEINRILDTTIKAGGSFEQRYFKLCTDLIQHYRSNPDIIPFLDHFGNFPFNVEEVKTREAQMLSSLIDFFEEYPLIGHTLSPATVANLFHENIKIIARAEGRISDAEVDVLVALFFKAMDQSPAVTIQPLEAA